jgi:hypothetical protein
MKRILKWFPMALVMGVAVSFGGIDAMASEEKPLVKITSSVLENFTFSGVIINNRTYVNLEGLKKCLPFYVLDKGVTWDKQSKTLRVYGIPYPDDPNAYLQFTVGAGDFKIGDDILEGDIEMINEHIYVPLREIMEIYNLNIDWNGNSKQVIISGAIGH